MTWFPGFSWFLRPSGGPYPEPWSLWTILSEAPLPAHTIGSWIVVGYFCPLGFHGFQLWWWVLGAHAAWQAWQWERDAYGPPDSLATWRNIIWRVLIGAVAGLPAWWWL